MAVSEEKLDDDKYDVCDKKQHSACKQERKL